MSRLNATQRNRLIAVTTPLGDDVLLFHRMSVSEQLGRLFQIDLDLLSNNPEIKIQDILGQDITIRCQRPDGENRYFNGFVSHFSQAGTHGNLVVYRASLRPWFWFLTRTADCRIFQNKTVPDIIKEVFRVHGFGDFEETLSGSYRDWEYCVQYRETDFDFISRLMEKEGIYYYFKHAEGRHILVLSDSISAHETVPGYEEVPYYPPEESEQRERDHLDDWSLNHIIQPGLFALNDFDFKKPKANLLVKSSIPREHEQAEFEIYDYPGDYLESGEGEVYVRTRIEELQAQHEQVEGKGNAAGLATGSLFKLIDYPREDQNREYLITATTYEIGPQEYESAFSTESKSIFYCSLTAIDKQQAFRTPRKTKKPIVLGPQTAVVVGKSGEEIWTDKYGRVKVQFHWDRVGEVNENSSCWIRVSHPWAGKNWGAVAIPRIGQEVIVSFLEGDPDQPIITGGVYNDNNMPPYELPANATQSGVKTRSSKGGTPDNFNEMRFEDKKGSEEVYIHAEKDQNNIVENDETTSVGHDRTEDVGNDETITIGNNRTETVGVNETISIGSNRSVTIGSNKSETIAINKAETIGVAKELTIGGAYQVTVGAAMNETIGGAKAEEIGAIKSVNVGLNSSENIGKNKSVDAGGNVSESAGKDVSISSGKKMSLKSGDDFSIKGDKKGMIDIADDFSIKGSKKGVIDIADELTIKVGKAIIKMKKNGDITINGKKIVIKGSSKVLIN